MKPALIAAVALLTAFAAARAQDSSYDLAAIEKKVHSLVNEERRAKGLSRLAWDSRLAQVARAHSRDMARRDFFSHENPDDEDPVERARKAGLSERRDYTRIGENIFMVNTVASIRTTIEDGRRTEEISRRSGARVANEAIENWMKSPGHRANLLSRDFESHGIGAAISKDGNIYLTELFLRPSKPPGAEMSDTRRD